MGGGILQLAANSIIDNLYLTGNPEITYFKAIYRRHTNFTMEIIEHNVENTINFGETVNFTISRTGDLINQMYLHVVFDSTNGFDVYAGLKLIKSIELYIGGNIIDKQYGEWMFIWNELSLNTGKRDGYDVITGRAVAPNEHLFIPLNFWFCRNPGLALPLISLQYQDVKVKVNLASISDIGVIGTPSTGSIQSISLLVGYIFLDTDERRRFAENSHEYLIEQLQFNGEENIRSLSDNRIQLNFKYPVKELIWVIKDNIQDNFGEYRDINTAKLQLNGKNRFETRNGEYFSLVQPYQHHTNIPSVSGINVYSFAISPEEYQPTGTLNFSQIDSATLNINTKANSNTIKIYATNYNVLRIMSGMGGLAYS